MNEQNPKRIISFLFIVLCLTSIVIISILRERIVSPERNQFTVSAQGEALAKPDIALLTLGVQTPNRMDVSRVISENSKKMNEIIEVVKAEGVEEKDIKTTSYQLSPAYDYIEGRRELRGYQLTQQISVKVRDLEKVGRIIELSTIKGANQIGNISFTIDDMEDLKRQAREQAIQKAQEKAEEISKITEINLGKIINFYETSGDSLYQYDLKGLGDYGVEFTESSAPQIEAGEQEVKVTVSLTYEIK